MHNRSKSRGSGVAAVLACFFLLTALPLAAGGKQEQPAGTSSRRNAGSGKEIQKLAEARPAPVENIDGYTVRIASWWSGPDDLTMVGRDSLRRWAEAEKKYNVKLQSVQVPNPQTALEKLVATVMLGEPFADVVYLDAASAIPALVEANMILPLDDYFDFSDPNWRETANGIARYKGHIYGLTPYKLGGGGGIWYNRTLFQREGLPDLHELQENGEWTWEKYFEIAKAATRDTDGDGSIDQWGVTIGYEIEYPLIWSNGGKAVRETADGFRFALDEPAAIEALDFISRLYRSNVTTTRGESLFIAGRAAMYGGELFQGRNMLLNMQDDYGWVFYPKGPRMDDYISVNGAPSLQVFPANLNYPPERLAKIVNDLTQFDLADDIRTEFLEGQLEHRDDIATVYEMMEKGDYTRKDAFPGLTREIGRIFQDIRKGSSPATAVEEHKLAAQKAIDSLFQ